MAELLLDSEDIQEEIEVGTEPPPEKRRRLRKKEVVALCRRLSSIKSSDILETVVAGVEADTPHFKAFPDRETLWKCICSSALFPDFLKQLIVGYTDLYKAHHRGRDKYAHFLVAWHEFLSDFAVGGNEAADETWLALVSEMDNPVNKQDRSAVVGSIAKVVYDVLKEKLCQLQASSDSPPRYEQSKDAIPDDDASVIRVSGFALYSSIQFRKKALGRQRLRYTTESREQFEKELWLLKKLEATDKSFIPALLKFQDRGHMVFMHHTWLSFGRRLFSSVRSHVNYKQYQEQGAKIFAEARTQVLGDRELLSSFKACIQQIPHSSSEADKFVDETVVFSVYNTIIVKMLNTINNDFLKSLSMLDHISSNKGTGAKLMLRDKLKGFAAETQSHVPKI